MIHRGHSAPDLSSQQRTTVGTLQAAFPDEPEGIMHTSASTLTLKGKPKTVKKHKKISEVENRLLTRCVRSSVL